MQKMNFRFLEQTMATCNFKLCFFKKIPLDSSDHFMTKANSFKSNYDLFLYKKISQYSPIGIYCLLFIVY